MAKQRGKHARPPARPPWKRVAKRVALAFLGCACALAVGACCLVGVARWTGDDSLLRALIPQVGSIEVIGDEARTAMYDGQRYRERASMTSILLMGHDANQNEALNGQVDFLMVAAIDTESGETTLIYIPRDTMVDVERTYSHTDEYADTMRLQVAAAFAYGSDFEHSAERMRDTVSRLLFNVPIEYYLVLDVNGVGALADAVGGVEVVALQDVPKTDMREGQPYVLKGEQARQYVVERDEAVAWSAMDRLERQEQFMRAFASRFFDTVRADPFAAMGILDELDDQVLTDLGSSQMAYLVSLYLRHGIGDLRAVTLEGESTYNEQTGYEEYGLDEDAVLRTLLDVYYEPVGA